MEISDEPSPQVEVTDESQIGTKKNFYAYKNLIVVSIVFMLVFFSYQSLETIQTSIHSDPRLGFASLCVIYAMFAVSSLALPTLMINKTGYKYTIFISIFGYITFTLAHFYPRWSILIAASMIIGLSAAPLWAAQFAYVVELAADYASTTKIATERMVSRFVSIFFFINQLGQLAGNAVLSLILKPTKYENATTNSTHLFMSCGSNFTSESVLPPGTQHVKTRLINMLIGTYLAGMLIALIILVAFLDRSTKENEVRSITSLLVSTANLIKRWKMQMLVPLATMIGLEQGFVFGDFTKAFVTCSVGIDKVGIIIICFAASNCSMSFLSGFVVKWTGICLLLTFGMLVHAGLLVFLLHYKLSPSPLLSLFIISAIWGMCDSIWQTQTSATFGIMFPDSRIEALALMKLGTSLGYVISFSYGNLISIRMKLRILLSFIVIGMALYLVVEYFRRQKEKNDETNHGQELPDSQ